MRRKLKFKWVGAWGLVSMDLAVLVSGAIYTFDRNLRTREAERFFENFYYFWHGPHYWLLETLGDFFHFPYLGSRFTYWIVMGWILLLDFGIGYFCGSWADRFLKSKKK